MPAAGPMDLNEAGRPQWRELLPLFGVALLGILVAALGGIVFLLSLADDAHEVGGWNLLGCAVGLSLIYGGGSWFWSLRAALVGSVTGYQRRVEDWHYAMLAKYENGDGNIVAQQISEWAYNPMDMRSLLVAYAAILASEPSRLTVDALCQHGLWIRVEHRDMKILTFTQDSAAAFLNMLGEARIIAGRGPRQAGQLLLDKPQDQVQRLVKMAARNPAVMATMETLESE
jgi:hypothetical protein